MRRMRLALNPTPVQLDRLPRMAMDYSIWRGIFGSGVGIGMGRLMVAAPILEALRQDPSVWFGAAIGTATRATVGRRIGIPATQRLATTASSGSGPSFPQVSEKKAAL